MATKTTVVTMFFNLKNLKDTSSQTRPMSFYLENGRQTLKLKFPMVIFCDKDTVESFKKIRDEEVGDSVPTEYILKNITEYDYYQQCWGIIRENRNNSKHYKDPNDRNTPSYCLLSMFKVHALRCAYEKNFFNTSHYAWVDLGCSHVVRKLSEYGPKMLLNPGPKVKVCYIHYRSKDVLSSMERYMAAGGRCGIAAGAFTVEASYINRFYVAMFSILYEMLYKGVGHSEETVLTYCYNRYPELFTLYYGDYYSIFTNYHKTQDDLNSVKKYFIENAKSSGRLDLATEAARSVMIAINEGLNLSAADVEYYKRMACPT
jgi:hypothetical protein